MIMKKRLPYSLFLLNLLLVKPGFSAISSDALWLPRSYQAYLPQLMLAAQQAESTERCHNVLNGGLANDKPVEKTVEFRVTCRDEDKRSYNLRYSYHIASKELVLSHEQKSRYRIEKEEAEKKAEAEKAERLRKEQVELETIQAEIFAMAEQEALAVEKSTEPDDLLDSDIEDVLKQIDKLVGVPIDEELAWQACLKLLKAKTKGMRDLEIEQEPRPVSEIVHKVERKFEIDFQAKNPQFRDLYYRAFCHVWQDGSGVIDIKARKRDVQK
jgi:hypothetical protein